MFCCGGHGADTPVERVFGAIINRMQSEDLDGNVPNVLKESARYLRNAGLNTQGIFRRAANAQKMKLVKAKYNTGEKVNFDEFGGVHMAANVMKTFLRDLREPLMTTQMYPVILKFDVTGDATQGVAKCRQHLLSTLPARNLTVVRALVAFLIEVISEEKSNGMNSSNVSIVFGPNLFWGKGAGPTSTKVPSVNEMSKISAFTKFLIENSDQIFANIAKDGYVDTTL